jgi:hypothetical protein
MMKTMYDEIRSVWVELLSEGGARQRLLDNHPLRLFYGSDASSKAVFFLATPRKPSIPELSTDVKVERGQRKDGSWTVVLTLQDPTLTQVFMTLCIELAEHSQQGAKEIDALALFFESLQQWRALLRSRRGRLTKDEIRGLVAEMAFALGYLTREMAVEDVLSAWHGPMGSPQDFSLPTGELYEVKSVHTGARTVQISSTDQLDPFGDPALALVLMPVDECAATTANSVNLAALVSKFRSLLGLGNTGLDALAQRFEAIGFDPLEESYNDQYFLVSDARFYRVMGDFPRIRRLDVPSAIDQLRYRLRLSGIADYHVQTAAQTLWLPKKESSND